VRGAVGFLLIFLVLLAKLRMEEEWMRSQFGETYATYAHRTPPWCRTFSDRHVSRATSRAE